MGMSTPADRQPDRSRSTVRASLSRRLEDGTWTGPLSRILSEAWQRMARPVRPLVLPKRAIVIGVGGATLGGSGKTPLVIEIARRLSTSGIASAVVACCHRTRIDVARAVKSDDVPASVGDEAVMMTSLLAPFGVPVVVAPRRQLAVDLAARMAPCIVVDGLLQAKPERLALSVLALDARAPWGAGRCPPAGDLRAARSTLLSACDCVLLGVDETSGSLPDDQFDGRHFLIWRRWLVRARSPHGRSIEPRELVGRRIGLLTTVARPERLSRQLAWYGVCPEEHRRFADHAFPSGKCRWRTPKLDLWLATRKCGTKIGPVFEGVPVWVLEDQAALPDALLRCIIERAGS